MVAVTKEQALVEYVYKKQKDDFVSDLAARIKNSIDMTQIESGQTMSLAESKNVLIKNISNDLSITDSA